jgi:hypothetical protein
MSDLEILSFIVAPAIIILFGLILILVSQITAPDPYESPNAPRHGRVGDVAIMFDDHSETTIIEGVVEDLEAYVQVGRRGRYSAARNMRVSDDWKPYIGDLRLTILTQGTAEWLFVRKTKDQLTDPYERAQWATQLATIG